LQTFPGCDPVVAMDNLSPVSANGDGDIERKLDLFQQFAVRRDRTGSRRCHFHFHHVPLAGLGPEQVTAIRFRVDCPGNRTVIKDVPCKLLFRAVGYCGQQMPGLPFNERTGSICHCAGRLIAEDGSPLHGTLRRWLDQTRSDRRHRH